MVNKVLVVENFRPDSFACSVYMKNCTDSCLGMGGSPFQPSQLYMRKKMPPLPEQRADNSARLCSEPSRASQNVYLEKRWLGG